jgi:hypothetical protein
MADVEQVREALEWFEGTIDHDVFSGTNLAVVAQAARRWVESQDAPRITVLGLEYVYDDDTSEVWQVIASAGVLHENDVLVSPSPGESP